MHKPVIIVGATRRGKDILDILQKNDILVYGFLDDTPALRGKEVYYVPVLGHTQEETYLEMVGKACTVVIALEDKEEYQLFWAKIAGKEELLPLPNAVHPQAILATHVQMGQGNCIQAGAQIGPDALVSSHCYIGHNVILGAGTVVHDFVHVGAGTILGPNVLVEEGAWIGERVVISGDLVIGKEAYIPSGLILSQNVQPYTKLVAYPPNYLPEEML